MKRNEKVEHQAVGDKTVLFDTESFRFYELNPTMRLIWESLEEESDENEIAEKMTAQYNVEKKRAVADIRQALDTLKDRNLIC